MNRIYLINKEKNKIFLKFKVKYKKPYNKKKKKNLVEKKKKNKKHIVPKNTLKIIN